MDHTTCDHQVPNPESRLFCPSCGKLIDRSGLASVRLMGYVGVRYSESPAIERFWATGDCDTPGL